MFDVCVCVPVSVRNSKRFSICSSIFKLAGAHWQRTFFFSGTRACVFFCSEKQQKALSPKVKEPKQFVFQRVRKELSFGTVFFFSTSSEKQNKKKKPSFASGGGVSVAVFFFFSKKKNGLGVIIEKNTLKKHPWRRLLLLLSFFGFYKMRVKQLGEEVLSLKPNSWDFSLLYYLRQLMQVIQANRIFHARQKIHQTFF